MKRNSSVKMQLFGNTILLIATGFYCNTNFNVNYTVPSLILGVIGSIIAIIGFFRKDKE